MTARARFIKRSGAPPAPSLAAQHGAPVRGAFTLMEIVLSIALTSVVMYLLTTAIELFLIRVESSRARVESAQIARTLLDQMAADLVATRLYAPPAAGGGSESGSGGSGGASGGGGQTGGQAGTGASAGTGAPAASGATGSGTGAGGSAAGESDPLTASDVHGIYGTVEQIRTDRAAYSDWERATREIDSDEAASMADMPLTVRYYVVDGERLTIQQLAQRGVPEDDKPSINTAGLYRASMPTAALANGSDPLETAQDSGAMVELLAPEVVKLELQYYNGEALVDSWDAFEAGGLPTGVEICLTIYEPRANDPMEDDRRDRFSTGRFQPNELVEYRRFVRIPSISPQQPAEALLPAESAAGEGTPSGAEGAGAGQGGGTGTGAAGDGQNQSQGANGNATN